MSWRRQKNGKKIKKMTKIKNIRKIRKKERTVTIASHQRVLIKIK